jgi:hypothetical protein
MKYGFLALAGATALAGCGGSGAAAPDTVQGTWAADCSSPFVKFDGGTIHVYPDNADYKLKSATLNGANLDVAYDSPQGSVSETYVMDGDTLRLDHGTYGGQEATWHKAPMKKCG